LKGSKDENNCYIANDMTTKIVQSLVNAMKWLLYFFIGLIVFNLPTYSQSIILYDIDASNFPTMTAKFFAYDIKQNQVTPDVSELVLTENGIQRAITGVFCPASRPPTPLSSVLTIDVSGSMKEKYNNIPRIELAQIAARTWVNALDFTQNECAVTSFDDANYLNQDFTNNSTALITAINSLSPRGGTDYDKGLLSKMAGSLEITKRAQFKRVVVFLTDGYPNQDPQVFDIVREANIQNCVIFAVMIGLNCPQSLKEICARTNGLWFENINSVGEALEAYDVILKRSQGIEPCTITWQSAASCESEARTVLLKWNNGPSSTISYTSPTSDQVKLNITPKSVYMKYKAVGVPFDTTVTVTAQKSPVTVNDITSSNSQYDISPKKFTLAPGRSIQLTVRYTPATTNYTWTKFDFQSDICPLVLYASAGQKGKNSPQDALKLTKPNGNEYFVVGSDTVISWTGIPASDIVRLEYSIDNGTSWILLTDNATGLRYEWKNIPNTPSNLCLVRVTQLNDGNLSAKNSFPLIGHTDGILSARWSPDGSRVATASADSTAIVWDPTSGAILQRFTNHKGSINSIEWNRESTMITTASSDSTARIWDATQANEIMQFKGHTGGVECASLSPDRIRMATASKDNFVRIWDTFTGKQLRLIAGHTPSISLVSWNPDAIRIATSRSDTRIFEVATGKEIVLSSGHTNFIDFMAWSPNGTQMATASRDSTARIWDASDGTSVLTLAGHTGRVNHLCWSPDGHKIATASSDNTAQLWDAQTGNQLVKLSGHTAPVLYVSWSPDGRGIATASADNTARVWDAVSGKELQQLKGHADMVREVSWSPDGNRLVTCSPDNSAWIWDVSSAFAVLSDVSDAVFSIVAPNPSSKDIDMKQVLVGSGEDSLVPAFVANQGLYSFKVKEIQIIGTDAADFSLISGFPPFDVPPLGSKSVEFRFSPTSIGIKTATILVITQNDTLRQLIRGEGVSPQITVINSIIDFGQVEVKTEKDSLRAVTIKNIGTAPITITNTRYGLPNDKDFSTIAGSGSFVLGSGDSAKMDLRFVPSSSGRTSGQLLFDFNGTGSPATVQLFGEGIAPKLLVVNDTINFGKVKVGTNKDTLRAVTVKNIGTIALTINSVQYLNPNTNEFTIISGGGTFIVQPQQSVQMDLRFTPSMAGVRIDKLLFDYNGTASPAEVVVIGEGEGNSIVSTQIVNRTIDFGKVDVGSYKDTIKAVTIRNNGTVAVTITSIQPTNSTETAFTILTNPTPLLLKPNDTIRLDMRFAPNALGKKSNYLLFDYAESTLPIEVELLGEGVNSTPSVQLLTSIIDFGRVEIGSFKDTLRAVTLKNNGQVPVTLINIDPIIPTEKDFSILNNPAPLLLAPNDTLRLDMRFTPSIVSQRITGFRFNFAGSVSPITLSVLGEGFTDNKPTASAMLSVGSAEAKAGEIVMIPIKLTNGINILQAGITTFHVQLKFNATLLEPIGTTPRGILQGNNRIIELDIPPKADANDILKTLEFRAGLGNDSMTSIILDTVRAIGGIAQMSRQNGTFHLLGICHAGGARLLNPNGAIILSMIRPNPANDYAEVELETTEIGQTTLELYNANGQKVRTFINGTIEPAHRIISLDMSDIHSGMYVLTLQTPTERRSTILEVVR
jgi:WD40 repeat protein